MVQNIFISYLTRLKKQLATKGKVYFLAIAFLFAPASLASAFARCLHLSVIASFHVFGPLSRSVVIEASTELISLQAPLPFWLINMDGLYIPPTSQGLCTLHIHKQST